MANNLVKGKIYSSLVVFAIPIFFSTLLQTLYGAIDVMIVGQYASSSSISAVATGSQLVMTLIMVFAALSMGTTILLGQKIGAEERAEAGKVLGTTIVAYGFIAVVITVLMVFFAPWFVGIMNAPGEAFSQTVDYVRISGYGSVFLIAYNVFSAIFRGIGDSKTPLIAVAIACVLNVFGDLLLVGYFDMAAAGAAIATIAAQAISVIISIVIARKKGLPFEFSRKDIRLDREYSAKILSLGAPIAVQACLVSISFLVVMAIVNNLGVIASAGVGVSQKLVGFLLIVPISSGQALATFVAHNVGAGEHGRALKAKNYAIETSLGIGVFIAYLSFVHGDILLSVFTKDRTVILAGWEYLKTFSLEIILTSFMFCFVGYFNGYGKTRFTMFQGIFGAFAIRIPVSYLMSLQTPVSLFNIGLATPLSTLVQDVLCLIYFIHFFRTDKAVGKARGRTCCADGGI